MDRFRLHSMYMCELHVSMGLFCVDPADDANVCHTSNCPPTDTDGLWTWTAYCCWSALLLTVCCFAWVIYLLLLVKWRNHRDGFDIIEGDTNYEYNLVYLHQFPRCIAKQVATVSPYALKLETWLRLKDIKYKNVETLVWSEKRQSPFVYMNGKQIADSNLVIEALTEHFALDPSEGLCPQEQGASRAFLHLTDASLVWSYFHWRYTDHRDEFKKVFKLPIPTPLLQFVLRLQKRGMHTRCYQAGPGRHDATTRDKLGLDDIRAISRYLGNKQFLCGERMTMVDCAVFGHLAQILYVTSLLYPHRDVLHKECDNVVRYTDRIKLKVWPDWDDVTHTGEFPN